MCVGQSSVYTIDVNTAPPAEFSNPGYVPTEGSTAKSPSNDGLPSYEEAIGGVKTPIAPASRVEIVNEDGTTTRDGNGSGGSSDNVTTGGRRHRRRHRHHRHRHGAHNENSEPSATDGEPRRHRHRRGLRQHLAKIKRRQAETE